MLDVIVVGDDADRSSISFNDGWADSVHVVKEFDTPLPGESEWVLVLRPYESVSSELRDEIDQAMLGEARRFEIDVAIVFAGGLVRRCGARNLGGVRIMRRDLTEDKGLPGRLTARIVRNEPVEQLIARANRTQAAGRSYLLAFLDAYVLKGGLFDGCAGHRYSQFLAVKAFIDRLKSREASVVRAKRSDRVPNEDLPRDIPVTVVVPALNEEKNLPACLARLGRFAKVVVVDSGSRDATCTIAHEYGAEVLDFRWDGRFPKKRNWTLRNHDFTTEWVLFLDADEYVSDSFCEEVLQSTSGSTHDGFWLTFHNYFMGRLMRHGTAFTKLALIRVGAGEYERIDEERWSHLDMEVHEHPVLDGTTGRIAAPIEHDDYKGLEAYVAKHNEYSSWEAQRYRKLTDDAADLTDGFTPRQQLKYKALRRWWLAPMYFLISYVPKLGFLDGRRGLAFGLLKWIYFMQIRWKIIELESR